MENFGWTISANAAYIRMGFSSPTQAPFFFICTGDSMSVGYCLHIMPRPDVIVNNAINKDLKNIFDCLYDTSFFESSQIQFYLHHIPLSCTTFV